MTSVQLRLPLGHGHQLREIVYAHARHEPVAFCLVSHAEVDGATILLARHVIPLNKSDYSASAGHGAAWRGTAMLPVIELAMRESLGIMLVHAHDFPVNARLSSGDLANGSRLVSMFQARVPGRPHGSIVLGRGTAAGLIALPGREAELMHSLGVRWLGKATIDWPTPVGDPVFDREVFDRQALVVGDQRTLSRARVAVVGLCGGGSHVVQQLVHGGVGTIIGIDDDRCDPTNLHREIGMRPQDGREHAFKTTVMARVASDIGTGARFIGIEARVPAPSTVDALKAADLIIGCVDNLHARSDLMDIAWRYAIPYVDVGANIRTLKGTASEPRVTIGGNVFVFIPGGFCAWCCGFISDDKLRLERGGRDDRSYFENKPGEAQVVSFNAIVAGQAVSEVLQLLTAYRGSSIDPADLRTEDGQQRGALKYDGLRGTLQEWGGSRRSTCTFCNTVLGAGSLVWTKAA